MLFKTVESVFDFAIDLHHEKCRKFYIQLKKLKYCTFYNINYFLNIKWI